MPIYEFKCKKCGNVFEYLQFKSDDINAPCPACGDNNGEKLLSTFSSISSSGQEYVETSSPSSGAPSCGSSGGFS